MPYPDLRAASLRRLRPVVPQRYVVIHGFYGMGNVGDEAILAATLEEIRRVTELEPFVFAWNPERVREEFGVPSLDPNRAGWFETACVLLQARAYLLGGGGLLKDYGGSPASLERWLRWPALAHALGVRTMLWSVGVENVVYDESKELLRRVLAHVDVVTVRDPASQRRLQAIGITRPIAVTADPVPHYARSYGRPEGRGRGQGHRLERIAVCPRHWFTLENKVPDERAFERLLAAFAVALDELGERYGSEVVFVPFRTSPGDDDRAVSKAIAARMRYGRVTVIESENPTVQDTLDTIASADLVMAMRLHGAVMATAMGIPTVAVAYMPKVADYMASLGQSGFCADVEEVTSDWLTARVDEVVPHYAELTTQLHSASAALSDRSIQNRRLLADLLQ